MARKGPRPRPVENRFWEKVNRTSGCWEWTAGRSNGYGIFHPTKDTARRAHQMAWDLTRGGHPCLRIRVAEPICVLHHCDNPICVRPDHLFLGRDQHNVADMLAKGRHGGGFKNNARNPSRSGRQVRGEQCHAAKLTDASVRLIRARYSAGETNKAALAREFGVSDQVIRAVVGRQTWTHVI